MNTYRITDPSKRCVDGGIRSVKYSHNMNITKINLFRFMNYLLNFLYKKDE